MDLIRREGRLFMEIRLNQTDIENILFEWAQGLGYEVNVANVFPGAVEGEIQVKKPRRKPDLEPVLVKGWQVQYSLQDEGPTSYDEEFFNHEEALDFIAEQEDKNPLKGTIMYHLISPEGQIYDGVEVETVNPTPPFGGRLRQQ